MNHLKILNHFKEIGTGIKRNRTAICVSIGVGGFLALYVSAILKRVIASLPSLEIIDAIFSELPNDTVTFNYIEMYIFLISIVSLITLPFMNQKYGKNIIHYHLCVFTIFVDSSICLRMLILQRLDNVASIVIALSCFYFVFLVIKVLNIINRWVRADDGKPDLAKLTLIWIILITIMSLLKFYTV